MQVHINFPDLLTTELLANLCRDKILDACREQMPEYSGQVGFACAASVLQRRKNEERMCDVVFSMSLLLPRVSVGAACNKWPGTSRCAKHLYLVGLGPWVTTL